MTLDEFNKSVTTGNLPPGGLSLALQALWWDAKGDWRRAHEIAQNDPSPNASWVHAFLHRKEGDETNAAYWYAKAIKPMARGPFPSERDRIAAVLLSDELASA
ncbi:MAG: hypothetical protein ACREIA_02530 [Opitutaceae bacterium]